MRSVTDADVLRIMSQPREDFGHRGPTEDPADIRSPQMDQDAKHAVEAATGAPVWERKDTKRNRA